MSGYKNKEYMSYWIEQPHNNWISVRIKIKTETFVLRIESPSFSHAVTHST